jgi:hypothetical protein
MIGRQSLRAPHSGDSTTQGAGTHACNVRLVSVQVTLVSLSVYPSMHWTLHANPSVSPLVVKPTHSPTPLAFRDAKVENGTGRQLRAKQLWAASTPRVHNVADAFGAKPSSQVI